MHLLAATPGTISDGTEAVDPGQSPADLVVISAADNELVLLAEARAALGAEAPSLRLTSLKHLAHPMSVDLHIADCAARSRLVVARVLGGTAYWRYGVEQYAARLAEAGVPLALLPGDDRPDEELKRLSSVDPADWEALRAFLVEGGPANAAGFLRWARAMIEGAPRPAPAVPLARAGLYWPGAAPESVADLARRWPEGAPVAAIVFYRALVAGGGTAPVDALIEALLARGVAPLPVFVASLKEPASAAELTALLAEAAPEVVVNLTSFATGTPDGGGAPNPLAGPAAGGAPVLQGLLAASTAEAWRDSSAGLSGRDIAMNVALPEVDGRIITRAIGFKGEARRDEATECTLARWEAEPGRAAFLAELAARWARLRRTPRAGRRIALVLANYPNRDGRLANGVGLDTPEATALVLRRLAAEGYRVSDPPADGAALMARLLAGPTNWLPDRHRRRGGVTLPLADYLDHWNALPEAVRAAVEARWGPPEADPFFEPGETDCGRFRLSVVEFGNVVVGIQPARGYNIDPKDTYHSPDLVPPHGYLAFYAWLERVFAAHAVVHMGKHGNLEWLPGKGVALSENCFPEAALGPMPHVYPFIVNDPGEGTQAKRRAQAVIIDHLTPPLTRAESYGPLRDLEALVDEYYEAAGVDPRRVERLRREILSLAAA
ncbi:MAG: cobaltochelatase subunit CobN, partial [Alphaproteobacteria bacterium]